MDLKNLTDEVIDLKAKLDSLEDATRILNKNQNKRIQLLEETVTANNGFIEERVSDSAQHELQIKALEDWREEHVSNEITFKRMEYKRIQSLEADFKFLDENTLNTSHLISIKKNRAVLRDLIMHVYKHVSKSIVLHQDEKLMELLSQLSELESPQPSYPSLDGSLDPLTGQPDTPYKRFDLDESEIYLIRKALEYVFLLYDDKPTSKHTIGHLIERFGGKEYEPQPDIDLDPLELFWRHKEQYIHKDELRAAFNKLIKIINEKSFNKNQSTLNNPTPLYVIGMGDMKRELKEALEELMEGSKK